MDSAIPIVYINAYSVPDNTQIMTQYSIIIVITVMYRMIHFIDNNKLDWFPLTVLRQWSSSLQTKTKALVVI